LYDSSKRGGAGREGEGESNTIFTSASSLLNKDPENIGLSVLEKMGWKRTGLGRNENGLIDPVVLQTQTHRMGVGIYSENQNEEEDDNPEVE
jgi:hypothetical protein